MTRPRLALIVLAALCFAPQASAATQVVSANPQYSAWLAQSRVSSPEITVAVVEAACPHEVTGGADLAVVLGCTWSGGPIYVVPGQSPAVRRAVFFHELGHQFDYIALTDAERGNAMAALGVDAPWFDTARNHGAPNEVFADAYSKCARSRRDHGRWRAPDADGPLYVAGSRVSNARMAAFCATL